MKKLILSLVLGVALLGATPSCSTYNALVNPATNVAVSTYTVQGAEHTLRAAKDTFELFFGLVKDNHVMIVTEAPRSKCQMHSVGRTPPRTHSRITAPRITKPTSIPSWR